LDRKVAALGNARAVNPLGAAAQQDDVFVAFGSDEAEARAFFFYQAIQRDGGGVADHFDGGKEVFDFHAEGGGAVFDYAGETDGEIVGSRRRLFDQGFPVEVQDQVGEGAADVYVNGVHSVASRRWSRIMNSPFCNLSLRRCTSISMSCVMGWPGGRYSVSTCVPQPGQ
jgi:hypothetical protein